MTSYSIACSLTNICPLKLAFSRVIFELPRVKYLIHRHNAQNSRSIFFFSIPCLSAANLSLVRGSATTYTAKKRTAQQITATAKRKTAQVVLFFFCASVPSRNYRQQYRHCLNSGKCEIFFGRGCLANPGINGKR